MLEKHLDGLIAHALAHLYVLNKSDDWLLLVRELGVVVYCLLGAIVILVSAYHQHEAVHHVPLEDDFIHSAESNRSHILQNLNGNIHGRCRINPNKHFHTLRLCSSIFSQQLLKYGGVVPCGNLVEQGCGFFVVLICFQDHLLPLLSLLPAYALSRFNYSFAQVLILLDTILCQLALSDYLLE